MENLYIILGIEKTATAEEIKQAYRNKAKANHEDKGGDHDRMTEITRAYAILKDPVKRERYDSTGQMNNPTFDQRFNGYVNEVFLKIVETRDVDKVDLVKEFADNTKELIRRNLLTKQETESKIQKIERVITRLSSDGDGRVGVVLTNYLVHLKQVESTIDLDIEFLEDCLEVLSDYRYNFDGEDRMQYFIISSFT